MTQNIYELIGFTAIVTLLVFAVLRLGASARETRRQLRQREPEIAQLSASLQEALTRLKTQEEEMSAKALASEHLRRQIVDSITAGLLVVTQSGRVEILNPAGRRLLGVEGDPVGAPYQEVLVNAPPLADVIAECLSTGRAIMRRALPIRSTLRVSHLGVSVSPLAGADPESGVICLFSDLTTVLELEEQLRLKEALARVGELTAGIAHEFRNGLATIHGYSRLLDPQALSAQQRPYLEGIRQETEALDRVVTNFLNFARPEQVNLSRVDLGALARRAGDDIRHELPQGSTVDTAGEFADVQGDEVLLRQVFNNLIRNAVEACRDAGVTPAVVIEGHIDVRRRTCRVSVDDNGPGIPEDARAHVFTPFFTTRSRGTGLGLAIVQKIMVTHNGRVVVDSSASGGASIRLMFPVA
jgi:signal transduction histidine kinase